MSDMPVTPAARTVSRREVLAAGAALAGAPLLPRAAPAADEAPLLTRAIPSSGEALPVVGLGTAIVFDIGDDAVKLAERKAVVEALVRGGGSLIDTAPAYGTAESVVGRLSEETSLRTKLFLATKVGVMDQSRSLAEMQQSLERLRTAKPDLLQLWNVRDPGQDLALLRARKEAGHCRYIGITTSNSNAFAAVAAVLKREKPDFLQVNYSLADREAESELLPLARDAGTAVLTNLPFGRGSLFRLVRDKPLPDWAAEFDAKTWGQFFLKYLLGHDAVTVVIPGTNRAEHMTDNLQAGRGRMPDAAMRTRMVEFIKSLG